MYACKSILTWLSNPENAAAVLRTALTLARRHEAHVEALYVRPDASQAVPLIGEGMSGPLLEEFINAAVSQASATATQLQTIFTTETKALNIPPLDPEAPPPSARWHDTVGRPEDILPRLGRVSDLTVMARPTDGDEDNGFGLKALLFDSGRPLLLVPPAPLETLGERIAILWNGTVESVHAVSASLPLLQKAREVTILTARENAPAAPEELAGFLRWHGISADTRTVSAKGGSPASALLVSAETIGADLLVMGAYGHSRLRQIIFGGVTSYMLRHSPLPLLICH